MPSAITKGLRQRGVDVITAEEDGASMTDDDMLLDRTTHIGRVLFTQDVDFLVLAQQRTNQGQEFAGIAYAHQLSISVGKAVRDLELLAKVLDPADMRNRVEYLPYS